MSNFPSRLALGSGFPPLFSPFTVLVTPSHIVVCQETDLVVVVNAPWGTYSSSQLYPLPPLLPGATSGLTATVLLLLRLGWPLANPEEVFLRESAAGLVIVTVSGCSQLVRHSYSSRQTQAPWANFLSPLMAF